MRSPPRPTSVGPTAAYGTCGELAGPRHDPGPGPAVVRFRSVLTRGERRTLAVLAAAEVAGHVLLLAWLLGPGSWAPLLDRTPVAAAVGITAATALLGVETVRIVHSATLWVFAFNARDPVPLVPEPGRRVALLTTIVPSRESLDVVAATLAAMRRVTYGDDGVDVWVLDEGDDAAVRARAADLGVHHFTRHGDPSRNTRAGPFRARTKAGNHNAWLWAHGQDYDLVAQLDPDHVPHPRFLDRTLGFFRDPDVAFVVAPQVYGNAGTSFVAHAAAGQGYLFHGVVQRGGNGLGAPLLIGTNHVYRVDALRQVGGYQDSVIEDHLTSLTLHAAGNPATGSRWKGVYTPDVLAVGLGPTTWSELFRQQRRWAHGVAGIVSRHTAPLCHRLGWRQRVAYLLLQSFYPGVAVSWVLGGVATAGYLLSGAGADDGRRDLAAPAWALSLLTSVAMLLWLRRFNLARHERAETGAHGLVATVCSAPVYVVATCGGLLRRPLDYHVTSKGLPRGRESLRPLAAHAGWLGLFSGALLVGAGTAGRPPTTIGWALLLICVCAAPLVGQLGTLVGRRRQDDACHSSTVADPCRAPS